MTKLVVRGLRRLALELDLLSVHVNALADGQLTLGPLVLTTRARLRDNFDVGYTVGHAAGVRGGPATPRPILTSVGGA